MPHSLLAGGVVIVEPSSALVVQLPPLVLMCLLPERESILRTWTKGKQRTSN